MSEQARLFMAVMSKLPLMLQVTLLHMLGLSKPAQYIDLRSELTVALIRALLLPAQPRSISSTQKIVTVDPGVKGRIWISTYVAPAPPEPDVWNALLAAIRGLEDDNLRTASIPIPSIVPVEAEWTGYRANASDSSPLPPLSERERFDKMQKEVTSPATVLYLHGGAYYLCDPSTHRPTTKKLAKISGGRCYSVRYRLAPQHPFPAALLDALVSYLTLLYPPPDAYHEPVLPQNIVFAGDR